MSEQDIVPPPIPDGQVVEFTDQQLRQVYDRIELIDQHFERCCAFQRDSCHYADEYNQLYKILHLAGVPEAKTPFGRPAFEQWLTTRGVSL